MARLTVYLENGVSNVSGQVAHAAIYLLYDGGCRLCRALAGWLRRHDTSGALILETQASSAARRLAEAGRLGPFVLGRALIAVPQEGAPRAGSDAVIFALSTLPRWWVLATLLAAVPRSWREVAYRWVAARRYRCTAYCTTPPIQSTLTS